MQSSPFSLVTSGARYDLTLDSRTKQTTIGVSIAAWAWCDNDHGNIVASSSPSDGLSVRVVGCATPPSCRTGMASPSARQIVRMFVEASLKTDNDRCEGIGCPIPMLPLQPAPPSPHFGPSSSFGLLPEALRPALLCVAMAHPCFVESCSRRLR